MCVCVRAHVALQKKVGVAVWMKRATYNNIAMIIGCCKKW